MKSTLLLLAYLFATACCQDYDYDCRRLEDCQNGGTCLAKGTEDQIGSCQCASGFTGWNCQMPTPAATCTDSTLCKNGAQCYKDKGNDVCVCANGYYGNTCEDQLVDINCLGTQITFNLNFPQKFDGDVKLDLDPDDTAVPPDSCKFTTTEADGIDTRSLAINVNEASTDTACGNEYISGNDTVYTGRFRVHYLKNIETSVDQLYVLTCMHVAGDIIISQEITNVDLNMDNLTIIEKEVAYSPVQFELVDADGDPLSKGTQLYVGDVFNIFVYLTDTDVYKNILITSCNTNNTLQDSNNKIFKILDKGCPTANAKRSTYEQQSQEKDKDGTKLPGKILKIKAFKFTDSSKIGLVCKVKVCGDGDDSCDPPADCEAVRNAPATNGSDTGKNETSTDETGGKNDTASEGTGGTNATDTGGNGGTNTTDTGGNGGTNTTETGGNGGTNTTNTGGSGGTNGTSESTSGTNGGSGGTNAGDTESNGVTNGTVPGGQNITGAADNGGTADTGAEGTAERRRKRAADDYKSDEVETVSTVLTVRGGRDEATFDGAAGAPSDKSTDNCLEETGIIAVVVVLASVVAILFMICFVLTFLFIRRRTKRNVFEPAMCTKSDRFHIPRARVNEAYMGIIE